MAVNRTITYACDKNGCAHTTLDPTSDAWVYVGKFGGTQKYACSAACAKATIDGGL